MAQQAQQGGAAQRRAPDVEAIELITEAVMSQGYVLKDFTSITDAETEGAYAVAYNLINQGQFGQAEQLLAFLCQLDHFDPRFWMGLGACRQQRKNYEQATKAYAMVGMLDMENPMPALRAAECYLALGRLEEADSGLTAALHWAGTKPQYEAVRSRAKMLLDGLARRKEAK